MNCHRQSGAILILTALVLPLMICCMGMTIDFGFVYVQHQKLQNAADAAALAGAAQRKENDNATNVTKAVQKYVIQNYENSNISSFQDESADAVPADYNEIYITTKLDAKTSNSVTAKNVTAVLRQKIPLYFLRMFGFNEMNISAKAVAQFQSASSGIFDYTIFGAQKSPRDKNDISKNAVVFRSGQTSVSGKIGTNGLIGLADKGYGTLSDGSVVGNNEYESESIWCSPHGKPIALDGNYSTAYADPIDISLNTDNALTSGVRDYINTISNMSLPEREKANIYYDASSKRYQFTDNQSNHTFLGVSSGTATTTDGQPWTKSYKIIIVGGDLEVDTPENCDFPSTDYAILISLHGNIRLHNLSRFRGIVYAPAGEVWMDCYSAAAGNFIGQRVNISNYSTTIQKDALIQYAKIPMFINQTVSLIE